MIADFGVGTVVVAPVALALVFGVGAVGAAKSGRRFLALLLAVLAVLPVALAASWWIAA